jgi:hypothetical protein
MIEQVSVFLENKSGRLAELTRTLGDAGINMHALMVADTSEFGVARVICDAPERAKALLEQAGFGVSIAKVLAVEVPDRPGGLHSILEAIAKENINIAYMYAFVEKSGENAVMLFRFDQQDRAIDTLLKNGIAVLPGEKLYSF